MYPQCAQDGVSIYDLPKARTEQQLDAWQPLVDWLRSQLTRMRVPNGRRRQAHGGAWRRSGRVTPVASPGQTAAAAGGGSYPKTLSFLFEQSHLPGQRHRLGGALHEITDLVVGDVNLLVAAVLHLLAMLRVAADLQEEIENRFCAPPPVLTSAPRCRDRHHRPNRKP